MTTPGTDVALRAEMDYARALAASDLLPAAFKNKPANVLLAIGYGRALGLEAMVAINGITVIDGTPSLSAQLQSALVRRAGHRLHVDVGTDEHGHPVAVATLVRHDDPETKHVARWDMARATRAGLAGRGAWRQYPEAMLAARATTEVIRLGASDALLGVAYTPEELGRDDVVDVEVIDPDPTEPTP